MYTIYKGGYNSKHQGKFILDRPGGLSCYVILIVKSKAYFQIGETAFISTPNCAVIITPNTPYRYESLESDYKNDWLHFDTAKKDFSVKYGSLFNIPISLQEDIVLSQYFRNIIWELNYGEEIYQKSNINMLFQLIINKVESEFSHCQEKKYSAYSSELQDVRLVMQSQLNRNYTPQDLANKLNISPSYFQYIYKEYFGIPFKSDLIQMRLKYAQELLHSTTLSVEQIALQSGYTNEIHFYRQFKKKTGMTPREYQKNMKAVCKL